MYNTMVKNAKLCEMRATWIITNSKDIDDVGAAHGNNQSQLINNNEISCFSLSDLQLNDNPQMIQYHPIKQWKLVRKKFSIKIGQI